jgi:hypothetical protein
MLTAVFFSNRTFLLNQKNNYLNFSMLAVLGCFISSICTEEVQDSSIKFKAANFNYLNDIVSINFDISKDLLSSEMFLSHLRFLET